MNPGMGYFEFSEFDSKSVPGSGKMMRISTVLKLNQARQVYGHPITIRHGMRLAADKKRIMANYPGAAKNSAHEHGWAVDCAPTNRDLSDDWMDWHIFLNALWEGGFRRFGIMNNTIHVDDDPTRKSPAIWDYSTTRKHIYEKCLKWFEGKKL